MSFFKIIDGIQQGSCISLIEHKLYKVNNNYEADIYLDVEINTLNECEYLFAFSIQDNNFVCENCNIELFTDQNREIPLAIGTNYPLPCNLYGVDEKTIMQISQFNNEVDKSANHLANLMQNSDVVDSKINPEMDNLVTFDDNEEVQSVQISAGDTRANAKPMNKWLGILDRYTKAIRDKMGGAFSPIYQKHKLWVYIVGITACLILILSIILSHQLNKIEPTNTPSLDSTASLVTNDILKLPSKYTGIHFNASNMTLYGVVENESDVKYLTDYFKHYKPKLKLNIVTYAQIKPQLQVILSTVNGVRFRFNPATSSVYISGLINSMGLLDNAEIQISQQLPVVGNIDSSGVLTVTDFEQDFNKVINNPSYQSILDVKKDYQNGYVTISSYMSSYAKTQLQQQLLPIVSKYKDAVTIKLDIKDVLSALPFQVVEVYGGDPAYIVTDRGHKVFIGGVESGMTLLGITKTDVTFRGKFIVVIKLSDLLGNVNVQKPQSVNRIDSRNEIIKDELTKLTAALEEEKKELQALKEIYTTTTNANLKDALKIHMDTLSQDITTKEHELTLY